MLMLGHSTGRGTSSWLRSSLVVSGLVTIVLTLVSFGCATNYPDCDEVSSSSWSDLRHASLKEPGGEADDDLFEYAQAVAECGTLQDFTRAETIEWLGKPDYRNPGIGDWHLGVDGTGDTRVLQVQWRESRVQKVVALG